MSKVSEKQQLRRSEIIEAVIPLISAVAFDELSVNEICAAAGISVGSFYHYFEKKSDMLVGLLGLIDRHLETNVYGLITGGSSGDKLRSFAREWAKYVDSHGIERSRLISSVEPANTELSGNKRSSFLFIEAIMAEGQAQGSITSGQSSEELTELYLMALRAVTTDWSRNNGRYNIVERMSRFMDIWLKGIEI